MSAKSVAVKLLSRREHSTYELRNKLLQRDFEEQEVAQAIDDLTRGGWLSDERYTEAYIRMRQLKGFGPVRIAMELNERGVDALIIDQYLHPGDEQWTEILQQQYRKKYRGIPIRDYNDKAKRIRFLQYRGFPVDRIFDIVK